MSNLPRKQLFAPIKVGAMSLKHRVVMPATSRLRARWPDGVPTDLMVEYYGQRATDGGLIIAETSYVAPAGRPYPTGPGLYSEGQVDGWRRVVQAVHAKGGVIVAQLIHAGRLTSSATTGGLTPVTASVDPSFWTNGEIKVPVREGSGLSFEPPSPHRALLTAEIADVIGQYRAAGQNAKHAGFDGVEVLAAQGHLISQFLSDSSNKRTDIYGGSIENRERLLTDTLDALIDVWGEGRVAVRIGPSSTYNGMDDSDPQSLYRHLAERLNEYALSYLHIIEPRVLGPDTIAPTQGPVATADLRELFRGRIIAAGGFEPDTAEKAVVDGLADLIAFGRHFTSNPDLPSRIEHNYPLTPYDRSGFYGSDATAYTSFEPYNPT